MNAPLQEELERVFRAIEIDSVEAFSFGDQVIYTEDPIPALFQRGVEPTNRLVAHLQCFLYVWAYCRRFQGNRLSSASFEVSEPDTEFYQLLSQSNTSRDLWDEGWVCKKLLPKGRVLAHKSFLERVLWPGEFLSLDGPGARPRSGTLLRVFQAREAAGLLRGYYVAFGETPELSISRRLVRYYFHVNAEGGAALLSELTRCLNSYQLPFKFKLPNHPASYDRRDTAVLYIRRRFAPMVEVLVRRLRDKLDQHFEEDTPLFTHRLGSGLATADDPGKGESFGQHRCRLVAEGIWNAFEQGAQDVDSRWKAVQEMFEACGLDVRRPHLNSGSNEKRLSVSRIGTSRSLARPTPETFLDAAFAIGCRLCRDALWAGERCNWIGPKVMAKNGSWKAVQGTLGTDVYSGTSGVALFLIQLFRCTREPLLATVARGALAQAISQRHRVRPDNRPSFYLGWFGIVHTLFLAGEAFDEEEYIQQGIRLLQDVASSTTEEADFDVMGGSASAISTLLFHSYRSPQALELAIAHGERLLASAEKSTEGWGWKVSARVLQGEKKLCGLSHGAAGIGLALLELSQVALDHRFQEGAENAFRYERSWFSTQMKNWPDLRFSIPETSDEHSFRTTWCHGAPGIGLTRLRAFQILGEEVYRQEAEVALRTTARSVEEELRSDQHNYSLCHGLAGNAEVLFDGADVLGVPEYLRLAQEVGQKGMELYEDTRSPWPCGVRGAGESPSLMLGLAGIGHFYLRLHDPEQTPSVLLLTPPGRD